VHKKAPTEVDALMKLPREYLYNPTWRIIAFVFGAGLSWLVLVTLRRPSVFSLSFGLVAVAMALLLLVRRLALKRCLVLDADALLLPTGFLQIRAVRIPYEDINRVWRTRLVWIDVLCLGTTRGKFQILPTLLPEPGSFTAIEQFLNSQVQRNPNATTNS
jgi:hypothetical protein